jgi:hypothetical protein
MYAWSNFKVEFNEQGQVTKWIRPGDSISQSDLKCTDEDWQNLQDAGVVREDKYPPVPTNVPAVEYFKVDDEKKALLEEAAKDEVVGTASPGLTAPASVPDKQTAAAAATGDK